MSRVLSSLMPVVEGLPVHTPAWSIEYGQIICLALKTGNHILYAAVKVTSTSGSLTEMSTSACPIALISRPNASFGFEYAPSLTDADMSFTSNNGVNEPPPNPVAELKS